MEAGVYDEKGDDEREEGGALPSGQDTPSGMTLAVPRKSAALSEFRVVAYQLRE